MSVSVNIDKSNYLYPLALGLIIKDTRFFVGFVILVLITIFSSTDLSFYKFLNSARTTHVIPDFAIYIAILLVLTMNYFIVASTLVNKYILKSQHNRATILICISLLLASALACGSRIHLETLTDYALLSAPTPPAPKPDFVPPALDILLLMIVLSSSIFTAIYSLVAGGQSQIDYTTFDAKLIGIFSVLDDVKEHKTSGLNNTPDSEALAADLKNFTENVQAAIQEITKIKPFESKRYACFLDENLLTHLRELEKFCQKPLVINNPYLLLDLRPINGDVTKWIKDGGFWGSYQSLVMLGDIRVN